MGAISTLPAFLTALRSALLLRAGLTGVTIFTGPIDDVSAGDEAIVFAVEDVPVEFRFPTVPAREVFETYSVNGHVWIVKPGAGETVIAAARERALALLEQVHDMLDSYVGTAACQAALGVDDARITSYSLTQLVGDGYRDCRLAFVVTVKARFTPA